MQSQMRVLVERYHGKVGVVAAVLGVREYTVKRIIQGSRMPVGPGLRQRLQAVVLQTSCPVFVAAEEAEAERVRQRDARRAMRWALRDGRDG
ncbi:hypothetical protein ACFYNM_39355 [Streptomyces spororaveus]|uniref:hypothetical protein n=1 Tax=Streptomyces spororaveus TaxID=284039 RepID=UPI0036C97342